MLPAAAAFDSGQLPPRIYRAATVIRALVDLPLALGPGFGTAAPSLTAGGNNWAGAG